MMYDAMPTINAIVEAVHTTATRAFDPEAPWPWQDWLAEQWGARSFRFRVLAERSS